MEKTREEWKSGPNLRDDAGKRLPTEEEMRRALILRHGAAMQERFSAASVAICGLGGLGSHIAVSLARAGVGRLHLLDFDRVDVSNLHRQQYFADQVGMYKALALEETLRRIAPYGRVRADVVRLDAKNAAEYLAEETYICEAFDRAENKAMLVNAVLEHFPEKYIVAASGMAGISSANDIRTRRITGHFYLCGDEVSGTGDGVSLFSSRVMLCAAHQAHMILRLIAGEDSA